MINDNNISPLVHVFLRAINLCSISIPSHILFVYCQNFAVFYHKFILFDCFYFSWHIIVFTCKYINTYFPNKLSDETYSKEACQNPQTDGLHNQALQEK